MKYKAWGWRVVTINGNRASEIRAALKRAAAEKEKPFLIIGKTVMGKGAVTAEGESFERECETHGMPLSKAGASFEKTVANLGGDPADPFADFPDVAAYYGRIREKKIRTAQKKKARMAAWEKKNPELAAKLKRFLSNEPPGVDYAAIEQTSRLMMFRLVPEVMKGTHGRFRQVHLGSFREMDLQSDRPLTIQIDGEILAGFHSDVTGLRIRVLPAALQVIT